MNIDGEIMQNKIMFHDINNYGFKVHSRYNYGIDLRILNHGIYDKEDMEISKFAFWSDKWDATDDAEKERIWNETEKNFERNVERIRNRK